MAVTDVLREMVAINTIADNNNSIFMDHCEKVMTEMGFSASRLTNAETGKQDLMHWNHLTFTLKLPRKFKRAQFILWGTSGKVWDETVAKRISF